MPSLLHELSSQYGAGGWYVLAENEGLSNGTDIHYIWCFNLSTTIARTFTFNFPLIPSFSINPGTSNRGLVIGAERWPGRRLEMRFGSFGSGWEHRLFLSDEPVTSSHVTVT